MIDGGLHSLSAGGMPLLPGSKFMHIHVHAPNLNYIRRYVAMFMSDWLSLTVKVYVLEGSTLSQPIPYLGKFGAC